MELSEISSKISAIKNDVDAMLALEDLEPCIKADLESIQAHVHLLYNELGLDIK